FGWRDARANDDYMRAPAYARRPRLHHACADEKVQVGAWGIAMAARKPKTKPAPVRRYALPSTERPRRIVAVGAALLMMGLALVGTSASLAGEIVTLAGLLSMIFGIHTFGRLGPEVLDNAVADQD